MRPGCFLEAAACVPASGSVLLVLDAGLSKTSWPAQLVAALRAGHREVRVFEDVAPNPRYETVDALATQLRQKPVDAVIGLGGGSVLDAAKATAMLAAQPGSILDYEGKNRFPNPSLPFVAIPTTCGTGSEVTWVSVISNTAEQRKLSVKGDGMFPDYAFVDADLLTTLPPALVAATGVDALTHALEAYTGNQANPVSDALAEKAIHLLLAYLPRAHADIAGDAEAREAVMRASTLAGMAFGNADVGAVHCLSETLGGFYDVPHGLCNALLLAPVFRAHGEAVVERLSRLEAQQNPRSDAPAPIHASRFLGRIEQLVATLQLGDFAALQVPDEAYEAIAAGAVTNNSNASNPREMDKAAYLAILRKL